MLPKSKRMSQKEVDLVFSSGKYFKNKLFSGKYIKSTTFKASIAPPKKVFKTAVERNKVKRRVFSAISHTSPLPKVSIVVIPEKNLINIGFLEVSTVLQDFFKQLYEKNSL
jgi:ribonuclease P protein component